MIYTCLACWHRAKYCRAFLQILCVCRQRKDFNRAALGFHCPLAGTAVKQMCQLRGTRPDNVCVSVLETMRSGATLVALQSAVCQINWAAVISSGFSMTVTSPAAI